MLSTTVGGIGPWPVPGGDSTELPAAIGTVYVRAWRHSGVGDWSLTVEVDPLVTGVP